MTLRIAIVTAVLLGVSGTAQATVLCVNPSGSLFLRAVCKGNETQVDPVALGLVGPQGPAGPQGPQGPGVDTVAGFVYDDGSQFGTGFSITKLANGKFQLRIPASTFSDFPAIGVSGWGIPGFLPTVNVFYNTYEASTDSYLAEVFVSGPDGTTLINSGFQFVAAAVKR